MTDSLTGVEAAEACKEQTIKYRQVVRTNIDPGIQNQSHTNLSFFIFPEGPKKLQNGKPLYGFVKARGSWPSENVATEQAGKIVKEVDSKFKIRIAPTGYWLPITDDDSVVLDQLDISDQDPSRVQARTELRDGLAKEKQAEDRRIMREIREREEELKSRDLYDDPRSLEFYGMKMVTEMKLSEEIERAQMKIQTWKDARHQVRKVLKKLDGEDSKYSENWVERYNQERRRAGIPDFVPGEHQFDEYNNLDVSEEIQDKSLEVLIQEMLKKKLN